MQTAGKPASSSSFALTASYDPGARILPCLSINSLSFRTLRCCIACLKLKDFLDSYMIWFEYLDCTVQLNRFNVFLQEEYGVQIEGDVQEQRER